MSYSVNGVHTYLDFDDNRQYLEKPLLIYTKVFNKRLGLSPNKYACFIVEKGESTDGASIPHLARTLTGLCPKDKKIMLPAIGHDHLYQKHKIQFYEFNKVTRKIGGSIAMIEITQNEADLFIQDKMLHMGANTYQSLCVHYGLKIGGNKSWESYTLSTKKILGKD